MNEREKHLLRIFRSFLRREGAWAGKASAVIFMRHGNSFKFMPVPTLPRIGAPSAEAEKRVKAKLKREGKR